jgi:7-cyano-7-deazaguanine synthase
MKNRLIIFSGGMDSTTLLYEFKNSIKIALSFNYGSKHNDIELSYAKKQTKKLNIEHIILDISNITKYFKSDLLKNSNKIPEGHYSSENINKTVVPFRNGIMLSIATGIAESNNCDTIMIANHFGDHAIYPDCRESFIKPLTEAIKEGTIKNIILEAPYTNITKRDIALKGKNMNLDYSKTYSCYNGETIHCGKCSTCIERIEALNGFDTTDYQNNC